jgi:hypothetical protein
MIVQGANDPRVNKAEADQIVVALRDRNYPIQYLLADDEGHGFARPVNNMAMFAASEKFLAKYLGGRYQTSLTAEVTKRLNEITIDPKTVGIGKSADASASTPDLTGTWAMVADAGQPIELTVTLKQDKDTLSGSSVSHLGNGVIDSGKVSGSTFTATLHTELQGQQVDVAMEGTVIGNQLTGTFNVPGYGVFPVSASRN